MAPIHYTRTSNPPTSHPPPPLLPPKDLVLVVTPTLHDVVAVAETQLHAYQEVAMRHKYDIKTIMQLRYTARSNFPDETRQIGLLN